MTVSRKSAYIRLVDTVCIASYAGRNQGQVQVLKFIADKKQQDQ
jgi:hypothetical protein